jgi:hypothetical protein
MTVTAFARIQHWRMAHLLRLHLLKAEIEPKSRFLLETGVKAI